MAKQTKQVAKVKKAIDTDIIVENAIKEWDGIQQPFNNSVIDKKIEEMQNVKEPLPYVAVKLPEPSYIEKVFTKEFICSSVVARSKGTKVANFYQISKPNYDKNKPLTLFFDADEEVKFESGKKYNFIISEA